ncbi:MAG TPA: hypothetical protein VKD90_14315 [Gemmataceae bacterium]|nr:hypothetical protein [Gemmataceae bacterium]
MAAVRLQVAVNGRVVGTAGLDGAGYLNILLRASRIEDDGGTDVHPLREESELIVGGHDTAVGDMHWVRLCLACGDEVSVRLLGEGPSDPPAEVYSPVGPPDLPL